MEQYVINLTDGSNWTHLGSWEGDAKTPEAEVIVRPYDAAILFATGSGEGAPDGEPLEVPQGEGRRLVGKHFFVRLAGSGPTRVYHRGLLP